MVKQDIVPMKNKLLKTLYVVAGLVSFATFANAEGYREGFYAGADLSYARLHGAHGGTADFSANAGGVREDMIGHTPNSSKMAGAIHAGYMMPIEGTSFVVGLEPYFGVTPVREELIRKNATATAAVTATVSQKFEQKFNFGLPIKFGYLVMDDFLVYALVGLELGHFKHELTVTDETTGQVEKHPSKSKMLTGIAYGMGVSTDIDDFRVGVEVKNVNYKREKVSTDYRGAGNNVTGISTAQFSPSIFSVAAKVSYLF